MSGDLVRIQQIAEEDYDMLHEKDENGWQPIHEGARSGHLHIVKLLVNHGADINERTNAGGTPLYIAKQENEEDTINVIEYLENIGALEMGPDL
jgi:ankyrin repeat protein